MLVSAKLRTNDVLLLDKRRINRRTLLNVDQKQTTKMIEIILQHNLIHTLNIESRDEEIRY